VAHAGVTAAPVDPESSELAMVPYRPFRAARPQPLRGVAAALAAAGLVLTLAAPASAQSESDMRALTQKVDRLQRELNTLQRQVYSGEGGGQSQSGTQAGSGGGAGGGLSQPVATRLNSRLNALEQQMQQLTGMLEETRYQVRQLNQRMDTLSQDVDYRLSQLEQGAATGGADATGQGGGRQQGGQTAGAGDGAQSGTSGQRQADRAQAGQRQTAQPDSAQQDSTQQDSTQQDSTQQQAGGGDGSAPQSLGQVSQQAVDEIREQRQQQDGAAGADGEGGTQAGETQTASTPPADYDLPDGSPAEQYEHAFGLLRQADYGTAERALAAFLEAHPDHELAGNAKYWLGETYYVRGNYSQAAVTFAEGFQNYGDSSKAADNLLKLGMSLARLDRDDDACGIFGELLNRFPDAPNNILQRARREQERLECGG
jgi:tol-pal system protein YbgF